MSILLTPIETIIMPCIKNKNRKHKASHMKNSIQPLFFQLDKIQTVLEATETEICSICFHEDDKTGTEACVK